MMKQKDMEDVLISSLKQVSVNLHTWHVLPPLDWHFTSTQLQTIVTVKATMGQKSKQHQTSE